MGSTCPGAKLDTCNCFIVYLLLVIALMGFVDLEITWRDLLIRRCSHSGLSPAAFAVTVHYEALRELGFYFLPFISL